MYSVFYQFLQQFWNPKKLGLWRKCWQACNCTGVNGAAIMREAIAWNEDKYILLWASTVPTPLEYHSRQWWTVVSIPLLAVRPKNYMCN